ncbi:uncharacterized protein LOC127243666 [Andrographis paniculata]|uniref:uncharacterized protein LOC127243666 n=1 Tax=Andrographis paniculata TaxID=175694 RepID=UPI0021E94B1C|nr:uncharacterized protein LOC127243666 [Andrographis paniculata]XP_051119751.1 uncharacterized protein LOC127243666 [Andrographis paniculata]XP_051119752.1 uncharacterized protein LOC127243666 [Andrographis paniculata]XP_051119753.1 uncharacterized protein LOC127243666 [Andrographis paniculata]XP_051119754.1 uncharacterized protein LOC127243666 [Andrographis paniculata]
MLGKGSKLDECLLEEFQSFTNWDDVICPICLDFPHNSVLLQCSSYDKGCRPFVCDTDHLHSNCLDRFKEANMMSAGSQSLRLSESHVCTESGSNSKPPCPLCRGEVTGWVIIDRARMHLDVMNRCCEEEKCKFTGTFLELRKHAQLEHPHARPSKIDPARKLDWENFQQSSDIIDVLSTIQSEVPHGVVLGDYVIEYGDDNSGDDFDDFHGDGRNWWTSCIFYQVFKNFRNSRNRRRSRVSDSGRGNRSLTYDTSHLDEGSAPSVEYTDNNPFDDDGVIARGLRRSRTDMVSSRRRHNLNFNS